MHTPDLGQVEVRGVTKVSTTDPIYHCHSAAIGKVRK